MRATLKAVGFQAKNIRHRALFFVRNVFAAFDREGNLRTDDLHANVVTAMAAAEKHIALINARRIKKSKGKKKPPTLIGDVRKSPWVILNPTLIDNIVREEPDNVPNHPYKAVPAAVAQSVIQQVYSDMQGWRKSVKAYMANPAKFSGYPKMPAYQGRHSLTTFDIPISRTNGKVLPPIGKKAVNTDIAGETQLSARQKGMWDKYPLGKAIEDVKKHIPHPARAKSFKVVFGQGEPRFVVVFDVDFEIHDGCLMAKAHEMANAVAGMRVSKSGVKVQKQPTDEMLLAALKSLVQDGKTRALAGIDLGITNVMGMAFADGSDGAIVSGSRIVSKMMSLNYKIDKWKASHVSPELKALLSKRDKLPEGERLSFAESRQIRALYSEMYSHPEYLALKRDYKLWCDDAFKKIAAGAIKLASSRGIQAIVVGLNKNWKTESNMGGEMNRKFHALAHSRILSNLRSAGEKAGILVVSIEESYTSKISFCNNTKLRNYEHVKQKEGCTEKGTSPRTGLSPRGKTRKENGGERGTKNRHVYQNEGHGEGKPRNWRKYVHAEINGAYNVVRKAFEWFFFNEGLSLDYDLYWLSPKLGVTPMQLSLR